MAFVYHLGIWLPKFEMLSQTGSIARLNEMLRADQELQSTFDSTRWAQLNDLFTQYEVRCVVPLDDCASFHGLTESCLALAVAPDRARTFAGPAQSRR